MQYRRLGITDMDISRIAFGCMSLKPGRENNERLLQEAVDAGINYFDTADLYGNGQNEEIVGGALKNIRSGVFIATKVGNQMRADGSGWDWNPSKEYILQAVDNSLRRLQTDHIDLYQLHGGTIDDPIDETIEAFEKLKRMGKIRYYGISSIRPNVIREWVKRSNMSSVMMQYSLLDRRPEEECFPLLLKNKVGVLARGSLAQGLLVDKPAKDYLGRTSAEVKKTAEWLREQNVSAATLSIQFALKHPAVSSVVVGIGTSEQLKDVARSFTEAELAPGLHSRMMEISSPNFYTDHR